VTRACAAHHEGSKRPRTARGGEREPTSAATNPHRAQTATCPGLLHLAGSYRGIRAAPPWCGRLPPRRRGYRAMRALAHPRRLGTKRRPRSTRTRLRHIHAKHLRSDWPLPRLIIIGCAISSAPRRYQRRATRKVRNALRKHEIRCADPRGLVIVSNAGSAKVELA
jgi:hypothetical protein